MIKTYADMVQMRMARRDFLRTAVWFGLAATMPNPAKSAAPKAISFPEISKGITSDIQLPEGYRAMPVLRWGDPLFADAPPFDPDAQSPASQARQVGFNCDFTAFFPVNASEKSPTRALLCVNHEYASPFSMFDGVKAGEINHLTQTEYLTCMEAVGATIAEIVRESEDGGWRLVRNAPRNRRITATTLTRFSGPVYGHARVQTAQDPEGISPKGTFANCAGGVTPWGTYLTCEENIDMAFKGSLPEGHPETRNHTRFGIGASDRNGWGNADDRFDVSAQPNEPNRFGYVVEIDPFDPQAKPVKHSALGRFKHESATCAVDIDGRVSVYSGDDEMFEYLYKFVSRKPHVAGKKGLGASVLDDGTLYVAQFHEEGTLQWLPLQHGMGPLTADNGFESQADVMIEARYAAELLGATPMDRPEDIEVHPQTGDVFVALTNNIKRKEGNVVNPRADNRHGHILRIRPEAKMGHPAHAEDRATWDIFLMGGDPDKPEDGARYAVTPSRDGWLSCPDNMALDAQGNLWIGTDGQPKTMRFCDSLYACALTGAQAGQPRLFMNVPLGAETTGPCFSPDGGTLFVSVQHPGEDSKRRPTIGWPDFTEGMPPRPSVVAIFHPSGKKVGYA